MISDCGFRIADWDRLSFNPQSAIRIPQSIASAIPPRHPHDNCGTSDNFPRPALSCDKTHKRALIPARTHSPTHADHATRTSSMYRRRYRSRGSSCNPPTAATSYAAREKPRQCPRPVRAVKCSPIHNEPTILAIFNAVAARARTGCRRTRQLLEHRQRNRP